MDSCKKEEDVQFSESFLTDPNAGLLEFINPDNAGFHAKMKCYPEDFVVTEIDSEGNLVVLDNYETPEERGCESLAMASRKRKLKDGYVAPRRMSEVAPLLELVTSEQLLLLEQLATSYKQNLVPDPKQLVDLGLVEDKQQRASLHAAVCKAHPVLMTTTYRNKQGEYGMSVMTNPKYVKLLEMLSPEEAEKVIILARCHSDPDASVKLADRPRDERTKLHIMLSTLFGRSISSRYVDGKHYYPSPSKVPRLGPDGRQSRRSRTIPLEDNDEAPSESKTPHLEAGLELSQSCSSQGSGLDAGLELSQSSSPQGSGLNAGVELSQSSSPQGSGLNAGVELSQSSSPQGSGLNAGVELSQSCSSQGSGLNAGLELSQSSSPRAGILLKLRRNKPKNGSGLMENGKEKGETGLDISGDIYTKFVLRKNFIESFHALFKMSEALQCPVWYFRQQGRKDKVGITLQQTSVKNVRPQRLLDVRSQLNKCGIDIGNFKYVKHHVTIGGHHGNHFNVTLRDLRPNSGEKEQDLESVVTSSLKTVKENGFINYFGLQRFNRTMSVPRVGVALLKNDMKQVVELALSGSHSWSLEAQELLDKQCFREASELLPSHLVKEKLILKTLHQYRGDSDYAHMRAIYSIPQDQRLFFLQSFCSVVWNYAASYRLQEYGLKLTEGDLVMKGRGRRWWEGEEGGSHDWRSDRTWLHTVSAGDVSSGSYSLHDVVLPVLGCSIVLPNNRVADKIKEMMALVGITLSSFRMLRLNLKCLGTYRSLIAHPRNLSWKLVNNHPLPARLPTTASGGNGGNSNSSTSTSNHLAPGPPAMVPMVTADTTSSPTPCDAQVQEGQGPALKVEFELGKSMYATMLVRELTKKST